MWWVEKPCKKFKAAFGEELTPVATLEDDKGSTCHVAVDGSCYVAYLNVGFGFFRTEFIFPELLEVFRGLPPLNDEVINATGSV